MSRDWMEVLWRRIETLRAQQSHDRQKIRRLERENAGTVYLTQTSQYLPGG